MLCSRFLTRSDQPDRPVLVFLHGLLGSGADWLDCAQWLQAYPCIGLDLPGHGGSRAVVCHSLDEAAGQVRDTLIQHQLAARPLVLAGYSLGARIAMHGVANGLFAPLNIRLLAVEGGHFGLTSKQEQMVRWRQDCRWARRFRREPVGTVLADWYQQPVFASLNHVQKQSMLNCRSDNLGAGVAAMLLATSLARQAYLADALKSQHVPLHYFYGGHDSKFSRMANDSRVPASCIADAGHNAHKEQPQAFAMALRRQLNQSLEMTL
ncbi:2-succinyl-6-hydroxy-2,4-cyclohexadiene-1-carboxylate synthase [Photobacterium sp. WH77]|uniref:2-succinyl-6-hydroxy-2, 4-cyclohexadiene-1-carboxylate synthase n=1 Tax=unclassified Photobacterium TaxID=2628852 RepID=UPI001EDA9040|nr:MULTISPECIES: 2-succinyl-6-hydroxy-2,4-cyclohexadiene-1-carboxylate synthase [unclassified Photobacterium]MCG2838737.1 2-succinyl-6-hydroxy-2,4-cyclohexadiene-1-carboxylate synthase [Photobacterium sp. WH77]MCG2846342.1 2-succinyl-6-hydroxy-2,4-cyclohexadiene-1-carboxylate synthase [Photobacterium sp. WH80]